MAIASLGNCGVSAATNGTPFTTLTVTLANNSINASSGRHLILDASFDNLSTADAASSDIVSVTGGTGTWTKQAEYTNGNGAAATGAAAATWLFTPSGNNAVGVVFTVTFSGSVTEAALRIWGYSTAVGNALQLGGTPIATSQDGSSNFNSNTVSGLSSKQYLFRSTYSKEANSTTALTVSASFTTIGVTRSRNVATAIMLAGEFRINTSTGETSNPTHAVTGDSVSILCTYEEYTPGSGSQSLTPSLFTNSQTFYAATVSPGAVTLTPSLVTNGQTYFGPVALATNALSTSLLNNVNTFYAPAVSAGSVTLAPTLLSNAQTFYAATVTQPPVDLFPSLLTNTQTFFAATLSASKTLSLSLLTNSQTFYAPSVSSSKILLPSLVTNGNIFYAPTVANANQMLFPSLFTNGGAITEPRRMWQPFMQSFAS